MDSDSNVSDGFSNQADMSSKRYLSRRDAAEIFGVRPQTISNWLDRGVLSGKVSRTCTLVDVQSIEKLQSEFSDVVDMEKRVGAYRTELEHLEKEYKQAYEDFRNTMELYDYALRYKDTVRLIFVKAYRALWRGNDETTFDLVNGFLSGVSLKEIAAKQGVSVAKACNAIKKGIGRLVYVREYQLMAAENRRLRRENKRLTTQKRLLEYKVEEHHLDHNDSEPIDMVLATRIEDLNLSKRTHGALKRMDIKTLGALVKFEREDIANMRNVGLRSIGELDALLNSKRLHWGMDGDCLRKV